MKILFRCFIGGLVLMAAAASFAGQGSVDLGKVTGTWAMEIDAGGEYYYLSFTLTRTDSELEGTVSEMHGCFGLRPVRL